jgi:hypothetical protein
MIMLRITTITELGGVLSAGALCLLAGQHSALADDSGTGVAPPATHYHVAVGVCFLRWRRR